MCLIDNVLLLGVYIEDGHPYQAPKHYRAATVQVYSPIHCRKSTILNGFGG